MSDSYDRAKLRKLTTFSYDRGVPVNCRSAKIRYWQIYIT